MSLELHPTVAILINVLDRLQASGEISNGTAAAMYQACCSPRTVDTRVGITSDGIRARLARSLCSAAAPRAGLSAEEVDRVITFFEAISESASKSLLAQQSTSILRTALCEMVDAGVLSKAEAKVTYTACTIDPTKEVSLETISRTVRGYLTDRQLVQVLDAVGAADAAARRQQASAQIPGTWLQLPNHPTDREPRREDL